MLPQNYWSNFFFLAAITFGSSLGSACNSSRSEQKSLEERFSVETAKPPLDCLDGRDTTFANKDYLRFDTVGDTAFDLKVGIGGKETFLGFSFDCNVPSSLIPHVLKHTGDRLILVRGYGFHFREVLICSVKEGVINIQRFETEIAIGAQYNAVVYPDANDPSKIIVGDLLTNKQIVLQIQKNLKSIKHFQITDSALVIVESDGKEVSIPFQ